MTPSTFVQKNLYKGRIPRAWVRIRLTTLDGTSHEREMLADTGCPCALILGTADLNLFAHSGAVGVNSNFGPLAGGWMELQMPEVALIQPILGYGSDLVAQTVGRNSSDFSGLVGLPLLQLLEYGGDKDCFWVRPAATTP